MGYGSHEYRANGVFLLEPSFFSQVLAVGIVAELCTFGRLSRLALFGLALIVSYSGTGLIVLAVCLPLCLIGRTLVASITPAVNTGMWAIRNLPCTAAVFPASGGAVTSPNYVPAAGDVVVVGLPINWEIMPMRLDVDPRAGPTPGLTKSIKRLHLRTLNSIGGQWATTAAPPVLGTLSNVIDIQAYPITQNADQPPPFTANIPQDVELDVGGLFGYVKDPEFAIQGYDPLPFFLLGIAIEVDLGGRT